MWNSHAHREFPRKFESANLSREIGWSYTHVIIIIIIIIIIIVTILIIVIVIVIVIIIITVPTQPRRGPGHLSQAPRAGVRRQDNYERAIIMIMIIMMIIMVIIIMILIIPTSL